MKKSLTLFFLTAVVVLKAQNGGYYGGAGHFMLGSVFMNLNSVNAYMADNQLPSFSGNCFNIGGGGYGVINNFVIGGEGAAVGPSPVGNLNGNAEMSAGYGMFSAGYILPVKSTVMIYPIAGIGWGGSGLKINYASGKIEEYSAKSMFITTEVNADIFMLNDKASDTKAGFKIGLCFGYMFNPVADPWKDKEGKYTNISNTFMNGFYIKLKLGGGGIGFKSKE